MTAELEEDLQRLAPELVRQIAATYEGLDFATSTTLGRGEMFGTQMEAWIKASGELVSAINLAVDATARERAPFEPNSLILVLPAAVEETSCVVTVVAFQDGTFKLLGVIRAIRYRGFIKEVMVLIGDKLSRYFETGKIAPAIAPARLANRAERMKVNGNDVVERLNGSSCAEISPQPTPN